MMKISNQIKAMTMFSFACISVLPLAVLAQTFSPYTPEQIRELNSQPIAPMQTPEGPVYLEAPAVSQKPKVPFDSRFLKNPDGEEQAEAQETESAVPFEPFSPTFSF
jgi:hypothetical protein